MAIIVSRRPKSISELSEFAGRAQPNVSRSLSALVNAGLVTIHQNGRTSVPEATALGLQKAEQIGLIAGGEPEPAPTFSTPAVDRPFLSVSFEEQSEGEGDSLRGNLFAAFQERGREEPTVAVMAGDVSAFALHTLDHWWRLLYRRDAPMKIADDLLTNEDGIRKFSVVFKCIGSHVERDVRTAGGDFVNLERTTRLITVDECERELLTWVLRPTATQMRRRHRFDRPVQAKLARIEDTYGDRPSLWFARTAGALGLSAYDLDDETSRRVRDVIEIIPDEDVRLDFASAILADQVVSASDWMETQLAFHGDCNGLHRLPELSRELRPSLDNWLRPHQRGTNMARLARKRLGLSADRSIPSAADLKALFGEKGFALSPSAPGELRACQVSRNGVPTVIVEDEGDNSTKFTLARAIGDYLIFQSSTSCVADLYTERQAVGRAFAAEFIAPREGVVRMVEEEGQSISHVAGHYGTGRTVISRQWENNRNAFANA